MSSSSSTQYPLFELQFERGGERGHRQTSYFTVVPLNGVVTILDLQENDTLVKQIRPGTRTSLLQKLWKVRDSNKATIDYPPYAVSEANILSMIEQSLPIDCDWRSPSSSPMTTPSPSGETIHSDMFFLVKPFDVHGGSVPQAVDSLKECTKILAGSPVGDARPPPYWSIWRQEPGSDRRDTLYFTARTLTKDLLKEIKSKAASNSQSA